MLKRDSIPIDAGTDIFVAHKCGRTDKLTSDKRTITPRIINNVSKLGKVFNAMETDAAESDVFLEKDKGVTTTKLPRRHTIEQLNILL